MKLVWGTLVMMAAASMAAPAAAQTSGTPVPEGPIVNSWYLGANTGVAVVEKFGGAFGLDGGIRVWKNLDAVGELVWVSNAVTRRQIDQVGLIATALGSNASGSIEVPVRYGGVGVRWVFESGKVRPYVLVSVGGANVQRKPSLTVGGTDVTSTAAQYGVTLGEDVIGKFNQLGTSGGLGMVMGVGPAYVDAGVRMLRISGNGSSANVARIVVGGGYRF